jgi:hypothetical protein
MTYPTVSEIQRRLEPVTADTFIQNIDTIAGTRDPTDSKRQAGDTRQRGAAVTG